MAGIQALSARKDESAAAMRRSFRFGCFGDHFCSFLECMVGGRHSAVDRLLQNDFLDVVRRKSSFCEGRAHVHAEFLPLTEGQHRSNDKNSPGALIIMRARPYLSPGRARDEILELRIE